MTKRAVRHDVIRDIIRKGNIKTQRDLVEQLSAEGYDCTQATVSRDIAGMGLAKSREGYYVLPEDLRLQRMVGELGRFHRGREQLHRAAHALPASRAASRWRSTRPSSKALQARSPATTPYS